MAVFKGFCDDAGHWQMDDFKALCAHLAAKFKGQEFLFETKHVTKRQGSQSMRYLRGVVIPDVAEACGYSDPDDYEQVWQGLAWKFLRLPDGEFGEPRRRSTAKDQMTQAEMTALIDQIITYAETSIPGCKIRRPEDVTLDDVYDPEWK
jgi:hypothetical protein